MNDLKDLLIKNVNPHDDYDLIQKVGSGTYGEVYKAKCHATNRLAAIKIIKVEHQEDFESIESEIRMMKGCVHPNIVAFYGSYIRRDKLWICMEYCGGGSLQDIYHATGPLPENIIAFVCREVLRGLNYLHSVQIIHRDVKAANILFCDNAEVKLADFGVSAQITQTLNCKRRTFIGTPFWMAPEVAAVDRKGGYNQSCDIWSVGILSIELAELQPPLYDLHPMRALYIMSKSGFKPPTLKSKEKWSSVFHDFVKIALTKNPKKRPSAERLLTHAFVRCTIDKRIILNLIEKARNPNRYNLVLNELDPEDELELDLPARITSKKSFRSQPEPDSRQYQPVRSQICKLRDSESVNNENYAKSSVKSKPTSSSSGESASRLSENVDSLESWMINEQKDQYQKSLLEIVDEELLQRGHKGSLTALDKEYRSTLTKTTVGQFASYINEPQARCSRLSSNSTAFRLRDTANGSAELTATDPGHQNGALPIGATASVEHNDQRCTDQRRTAATNHPLSLLLTTAKPEMQFDDFLNERFLINTDLASESSTPVDEFDVKHLIYGAPHSSIDLKLATEHFEDYPSDSGRGTTDDEDYLNLESELEEFEEANDELINLYASAISGLSIGGGVTGSGVTGSSQQVPSTTVQATQKTTQTTASSSVVSASSASNYYGQMEASDKQIKLRKQVEDKVERFKQNSKNRFSQQIESSSVLLNREEAAGKAKDDLALVGRSRPRPDEMVMILDESDDYSSGDEPTTGSRSLKSSLDAFSKQMSLLDEPDAVRTSEPNYEAKLNELSDWSIDTIETLINELCKEESLCDQPPAKASDKSGQQQTENEEFSTPPSTPKSNGSPNDSLNKGNVDQYATAKQSLSMFDQAFSSPNSQQPPSAPPRRRRQGSLLAAKNDNLPNSSSSSSNLSAAGIRPSQKNEKQQKLLSNGLPPTPQVRMGACFSKVFNACPLKINCCISWVHQITRDEHLLFGCDEGIYTLNMNELHDACLDQLFPRKTVWMYVIGNTLMTISGKTTHLYCHDLLQLHNRTLHNKDHNGKLSQTMDQMINRIPEKFVPWKVSCTTKISASRGVTHCCVGHNRSNGYKYLAGATASAVFLMQWYNPLNKFMLLKQYDLYLPAQIRVFEMIITPDAEYPQLCIGAKRHPTNANRIQLDLINLNSSSWFNSEFGDGMETVIPRNQVLNLICARQIDKDAILVCYDNIVRIVNLQGELKSSKKFLSEVVFEFRIESLVYLTDSVLAFHKHGMQGKSLKNCEITQDITDMSTIYRVLNMESKTIALESKPIEDLMATSSNIYVLAGHESSY